MIKQGMVSVVVGWCPKRSGTPASAPRASSPISVTPAPSPTPAPTPQANQQLINFFDGKWTFRALGRAGERDVHTEVADAGRRERGEE